jgi:methenyltetrahydrofolate cyclohydrolase
MIGISESMDAWTEALAAPTPAPAGGSAAAIAGALAAALVSMVAALTSGRESYAESQAQVGAALARAEPLRQRLLALATEDSEVYHDVLAALALPRRTEEEIALRNTARATALKDSAGVQYELLLLAGETADLSETMVAGGLRSAAGDAATATFLATAACRSAYWAIRANLRRMHDDPAVERMLQQALERLELVEATEARVRLLLVERL